MTQTIGRYVVEKTIGKGGMGEILLAYDPVCKREVAIKRIRTDLDKHEVLTNRFLREAHLTAELSHPGIITIYTIHEDEEGLYYTMPYVEGETLKQILRTSLQNNQKQESPGSIPALLPIFHSLCQTVAYAHSREILHRDLKPENVLVGKFGEVIILDWGLARKFGESPQEIDLNLPEESDEITRPGKIVGTVAYMAPERVLGSSSSVQTDIYALGVTLYQMLTLRLPFRRPSIKEFRKLVEREKLLDPEEMAPYRDVPPRLSRMVKKCLDPNPENRYSSMEDLLHDLKGHMEGRSEWFESHRLKVDTKSDWEFQENVLIAKHIALTQTTESADWVSVMVSKTAFAENTRLEFQIRLGTTSAGIGILLSVPEAAERDHPLEGYCLWLGEEESGFSQLFRNTVEVMHFADLTLKKETWHTIILEKVDHNIHFTLDGTFRFTYLSYLPLFGTHIGLLSRDADFTAGEIIASVGSQNILVSCLSIPDAFLAGRDYKRALAEYRRIGYSFPGHAEGREALFRAGVTLLEEAKTYPKREEREQGYLLALDEFGKLHGTPGAPLEYLGKALVYQALKDSEEEIKCLELGLRRYYKHPLISAVKEQILYRMHEASQKDRHAAYRLVLITLRLLPDIVTSPDTLPLFSHLITHWEPLPFLESLVDPKRIEKERSHEIRFATSLAFWLAAPYLLQEIFEDVLKQEVFDVAVVGDLLFSLSLLGSTDLAKTLWQEAEKKKEALSLEEGKELKEILDLLSPLWIPSTTEALNTFFQLKWEGIGVREFRTLHTLLQRALLANEDSLIETTAQKILDLPLSRQDRLELDALRIWAFLKNQNWEKAVEIFDTYPLEMLNQESTLLHPLYGCYLYATEGEEIAMIHFGGIIDTSFPRSWTLLAHELTNQITDSPSWYNSSFLYERRRLFRQLALFYRCAEKSDLEAYYLHLEHKEHTR
ncbi:MAG: Serine/threonine-protein kinase PknD [Chlamydiae bacterium]|nr:Serine/threonine-protein kinase PknD [Chlamydiota bacterium]